MPPHGDAQEAVRSEAGMARRRRPRPPYRGQPAVGASTAQYVMLITAAAVLVLAAVVIFGSLLKGLRT